MPTDGELLRRYIEAGSEAAFTALVRQHLDLVYSAALRQLNGDAHLAQDVAQTVFTDLARKAASLSHRSAVTGWLYTSTHFAAAKAVRKEQRRRAHEQEAHTMRELLQASASEPDWEQLRPALDAVMLELKEADRETILLRYFQNQSLAEVGEKLGVGEDTARKRVDRALEKLRASLNHRGITTVAALAGVLSANAVQVAPAGLAATVAGASLAGATAGAGTTLGILKLMTMNKLATGIIGALAVAGVTTPMVIQHQTQKRLRQENRVLQQQVAQLPHLMAENERLSNLVAQANRPLADADMNDLLRLRGEVTLLRQETNELAHLRETNRRLQTALARQQQDSAQSASDSEAEQQQRTFAMGEMQTARQLVLALRMYAADNNEQLPTNLNPLASYLGFGPNGENISAVTNFNQFEIVYQGPWTNIANPASVIVARKKQPWQPDNGGWVNAYGFADGHSVIHKEQTLQALAAWEKQHTISPSLKP